MEGKWGRRNPEVVKEPVTFLKSMYLIWYRSKGIILFLQCGGVEGVGIGVRYTKISGL